MSGIPTEAPPETLAFNAEVVALTRNLSPAWEVGVSEARRVREEGLSILGPRILSPIASDRMIDGAGGPIRLRVIAPEGEPRGIFLHIHGGGWVWGGPDHHDPLLVSLADATRLVVVSTSYRFAPEKPYPAGPDDCEAAALWLYRNGPTELGQELVAIGGESAGAHLAAVTCLRMRDRHRLRPFEVALLTYGCYDLRCTPSVRAFGDQPLILNTSSVRWFVEQFTGNRNLEDPDVSPIWADLAGLPPALFTVGGLDPMLDDSLFMSARWRSAGNDARLDVWPGAIHAFDLFDTAYGRAARDRMHRFVNSVLGDGSEKMSRSPC